MNAVSSAHRTGAGRPRNGNTKLTTGNMTRNIIAGNARADITHGPDPLLPDPLGPVDDNCAPPPSRLLDGAAMMAYRRIHCLVGSNLPDYRV